MNKHKITYCLVAFSMSFCTISVAQNVNITDANFRAILIADETINTNKDNEIQLSEAQGFEGTLNVSKKDIQDLTGIESFVALKELYCTYNKLTKLDLSKNIALKKLYCTANQLISLDLSKNILLTDLVLSENQLTSLDIRNNKDLTHLWCSANQLTSLDLSKNTSLTHVSCSKNQISILDLSKNTSLVYLHCNDNQIKALNVQNGNNTHIPPKKFNALNNPNLAYIQVDDAVWSAENWKEIDATASFGIDAPK